MKLFFILLLGIACSQQTYKSRTVKYNRGAWNHWSDADKNCINTRHEILKMRSLVSVTLDKKGCKVIKGKWRDYYFNETHIISKNVDIDHLVPLKNAHISGGASWSLSEKEKFANDPENLVITNKSYNRKKGSKTIAEWLPVEHQYACKYIHDWVKIKKKYKLQVSSEEESTIFTSKCY